MPKSPKRTSLASLAKELGVSRTTVSNAYNHPEQLSESLREKILTMAEELGYPGPDPMARSLRTKHVGTIGVLLTEHLTYAFEDRASVDFLAGMAEASYGSHTSMTLVPVGPKSTDELAARSLVNSAVVDGFVVYSVAEGDPYLKAALKRGLPTVICDQPTTESEIPFVGIDDRAAIAPAAEALVEAGHRKIGILCIRLDSEENNGPVSKERLETARHHVQRLRILGALDVLESNGIDPDSVPIVERHINDPENNIDAARELLENNPDLTAVLCTTDTMAFGAWEYAKSQGRKVPEDLSITGFDGIEKALDKGLTTVIQPNKKKGFHAGRMLTDLIAEKRESGRELLETTFHSGQTVATPRQ